MPMDSRERTSAVAQAGISTDGQLPSREDLSAAANVKRKEISRGLKALEDEIRHIPVRAFIREHPLKTLAGAAVLGLGFGRWLSGRFGSREPTPGEYRQQLMHELLENVIDDAAHAVASGVSTQEAIRKAVRSHSPIVFEIEREDDAEAESVAATVVHTLFALAQPYIQRYLRARLETLQPRPAGDPAASEASSSLSNE